MATENLHIVIIQPRITWGDEEQTISGIRNIIATIPSCDLVVLPEMFHTGFSVDESNVISFENSFTQDIILQMQEWASSAGAAICGSLKVIDKGKYYNRFLLIQNDKITATYDKRHLFSLMGEDSLFTPGEQKILAEIGGWRIQPFICYDLRFPAWCRNTDDADLQLFVANWPAKRAHHWNLLLQARAVENQCFTTGVNAVGTDNFGNNYIGDSSIYGPDGVLLNSLHAQEGWIEVTLSKKHLQEHRERYPFLRDRDTFNFTG